MSGLDLSVEERLASYAGMIYNGMGMWVWCYSEDGELYYSTCPHEEELKLFFITGGCSRYAFTEGKKLSVPFAMSDSIGMSWLGEFAAMGNERRLVLAGPVFFGSRSSKSVEESVRRLNLSVEMTRASVRILQDIPVMGVNQFAAIAKMLHYLITTDDSRHIEIRDWYSEEKKNTETEIERDRYRKREEKGTPGISKNPLTVNYDRVLEQEQLLLQCIRSGSKSYMDVFGKIGMAGSSRSDTGNQWRDAVNKVIVFTALCSRAAIEGGASVKRAKETEYRYLREAEEQKTMNDLIFLNKRMIEEFTDMVSEAKTDQTVSRPIRECCNYIRTHFTEELTLAGIAAEIGYEEYYLARKFYREMGQKLLDYIKEQRLEYAKILLTTTNRTIQDICDSLHFGSRNYFSRIFKAKTGVTPAAYREKIYSSQKSKSSSS